MERYLVLRAHNTRGMAVEPLTFPQIESYCKVYRYSLEGWEVTLLLAMDAAWMEEVGQVEGRKRETKNA